MFYFDLFDFDERYNSIFTSQRLCQYLLFVEKNFICAVGVSILIYMNYLVFFYLSISNSFMY